MNGATKCIICLLRASINIQYTSSSIQSGSGEHVLDLVVIPPEQLTLHTLHADQLLNVAAKQVFNFLSELKFRAIRRGLVGGFKRLFTRKVFATHSSHGSKFVHNS